MQNNAPHVAALRDQEIVDAIKKSSDLMLELKSVAELEALRKVLSFSHCIPEEVYEHRGLNQNKIESHIHDIFMRLEQTFGGFSSFDEEEN